METMVTTTSGADQYWAVAPPPVYAVDAATSPAAAASYFSPMFFQVRSVHSRARFTLHLL